MSQHRFCLDSSGSFNSCLILVEADTTKKPAEDR